MGEGGVRKRIEVCWTWRRPQPGVHVPAVQMERGGQASWQGKVASELGHANICCPGWEQHNQEKAAESQKRGSFLL